VTKVPPDTPAAAPTPGAGPTLSYDVPQTVAYSGQNYIEIRLEPEYFLAGSQPSKELS
jgi:hypothetical protein